MSFISKNPISAPEIKTPPTPPLEGTRGLFPMEDGWYDIDDKGAVKKIGGENPQSDWNQYDESQPDYVKNRTHYMDRRLYYTFPDNSVIYSFSKGTDNWSLNIEFPSFNFELGHTYEIKALNAPGIIIEVTEEAYNAAGCYINAYSDDGKYYFTSTGVLGEGVDINGVEPGVYNCIGSISYTSESLEEPFGGGFDEQFEALGGWEAGGGWFVPANTLEVYRFAPVPLDRKFLPNGIEYEENKSTSIDKTNKESDKNYPSVKAVVGYVDESSVQSDWLQDDRTAKDFIKNKTHGFSKNLILIDNDETSAPYVFNKNENNWDCYRNIPQCDLKAGHTYEFKTVNMGSVLCTPNINSNFVSAYSEDGKVKLSISGWMINNEEAAEISGAEIGDFLGITGGISYVSESLGESFGVSEWDEQFEEIGWDSEGYFCVRDALEIYECTPIPLDKKLLPPDVEYTSNKTTILSESSTDDQYPSAKAVYDHVAEGLQDKEDKSNKINSWDDFTGDMTGAEEYPTINMMIREKEIAVNDAVSNSNAYADMKIGEVEERVTTNEQSIAGAFTYCGELDTKISQVENDVISNKEVIDSNVDRIIALEDKDAELKKEIDACGDFEPVYISEDSSGNPSNKGILTEKVGIIQHTFDNQYKELYIRFIIPRSEEAAAGTPSTEKARWTVHTLNDGGFAINKPIYNMGNQFIQDFTEKWATVIHIKVLGNYCRTELWYDKNWYLTDGYARGMSSSTYSGYIAPSVTMVRDYIDRIKITFMTANQVTDGSARYLPAGTTYEIWGVRK